MPARLKWSWTSKSHRASCDKNCLRKWMLALCSRPVNLTLMHSDDDLLPKKKKTINIMFCLASCGFSHVNYLNKGRTHVVMTPTHPRGIFIYPFKGNNNNKSRSFWITANTIHNSDPRARMRTRTHTHTHISSMRVLMTPAPACCFPVSFM